MLLPLLFPEAQGYKCADLGVGAYQVWEIPKSQEIHQAAAQWHNCYRDTKIPVKETPITLPHQLADLNVEHPKAQWLQEHSSSAEKYHCLTLPTLQSHPQAHHISGSLAQ